MSREEDLVPQLTTVRLDQRGPSSWAMAPEEYKRAVRKNMSDEVDRRILESMLCGNWDKLP